jgi:AcrR family transcriptional regulator
VVLSAAMREFARTGYRGTSVRAVAEKAGISESYVFRLFGDKRELFVAALRRCFERIQEALREGADAAGSSRPREVLDGMAVAYAKLIAERDLLMIQVHALAASDDLVDFVQSRSGASETAVQSFFARGQLCHLITALGIAGSAPETNVSPDEPWVHTLTAGIRHLPARPDPTN